MELDGSTQRSGEPSLPVGITPGRLLMKPSFIVLLTRQNTAWQQYLWFQMLLPCWKYSIYIFFPVWETRGCRNKRNKNYKHRKEGVGVTTRSIPLRGPADVCLCVCSARPAAMLRRGVHQSSALTLGPWQRRQRGADLISALSERASRPSPQASSQCTRYLSAPCIGRLFVCCFYWQALPEPPPSTPPPRPLHQPSGSS